METSGKTVTYDYDGDNRLEQVTDWRTGVTTYEYDAIGRLITTTLPTGLVSSNRYDDANRLLQLTHMGSRNNGGSAKVKPIADYLYELDGVGNRVSAAEQHNGTTTLAANFITQPLL